MGGRNPAAMKPARVKRGHRIPREAHAYSALQGISKADHNRLLNRLFMVKTTAKSLKGRMGIGELRSANYVSKNVTVQMGNTVQYKVGGLSTDSYCLVSLKENPG